jgi:hypothetical protein
MLYADSSGKILPTSILFGESLLVNTIEAKGLVTVNNLNIENINVYDSTTITSSSSSPSSSSDIHVLVIDSKGSVHKINKSELHSSKDDDTQIGSFTSMKVEKMLTVDSISLTGLESKASSTSKDEMILIVDKNDNNVIKKTSHLIVDSIVSNSASFDTVEIKQLNLSDVKKIETSQSFTLLVKDQDNSIRSLDNQQNKMVLSENGHLVLDSVHINHIVSDLNLNGKKLTNVTIDDVVLRPKELYISSSSSSSSSLNEKDDNIKIEGKAALVKVKTLKEFKKYIYNI